jgi:indole-3-glycerol phosphate synthase
MENILKQIVENKKKEIELKKVAIPLSVLEKEPYMNRKVISLRKQLEQESQTGIIAEFKRQSPSKGIINATAKVEETTYGYIKAGASALSVLTDNQFFGGSIEDLINARKANNCPILRKEFIIDPYQVIESRSIGADAILLIAAILSPAQTKELARLAKSLGLEVLLEVHTLEELNRINEFVDMVGVNNRNLNDFNVSTDRSILLYDHIPSNYLKVSESGITSPSILLTLKEKGYKGFLMGERFMREPLPEAACEQFIKELLAKEKKFLIKYHEN